MLIITGSDHTEYSKTISFWVDPNVPKPRPANPSLSDELGGATEITDLSQS